LISSESASFTFYLSQTLEQYRGKIVRQHSDIAQTVLAICYICSF